MPIQIIGMIRTDNLSEIDSAVAQTVEATLDPGFVAEFARAHEEAGFDRVLIGFHSTGSDAWAVAAHAAASTNKLGRLIAHRPGFLAPTVAARLAATLDHVTGGRVALSIVTGGSDTELAKDGDWSEKDTRYRRTDEFLDILHATWSSPTPFRTRGRVSPGQERLLRYQAAATPRHPALLRRRFRGRGPGRGQARRRLHVLGRAARRHRRPHGEGPRHVPASYNLALWHLVLVHERRDELWAEIAAGCRAALEGERLDRYLDGLDSFAGGVAVALIFADRLVERALREEKGMDPDVAQSFVLQALGMVPLALWLAVTAEGMATSLQHWDHLVGPRLARFAGLDEDRFRLVATMPIGCPYGWVYAGSRSTACPLPDSMMTFSSGSVSR